MLTRRRISYEADRRGFGGLRRFRMSIKEFMNTAEERHAAIIGLCEVLTLGIPPRYKPTADYKAVNIHPEHHYYALGRGAGVLVWFGLVMSAWHILF